MATIIKGGTILTSNTEFVGDIKIEGETITGLGSFEPHGTDTVIWAQGKVVFPGGVDQHTHFSALCNTGDRDTAGYETTDAVLVGGTTTIVDFAPQEPGKGFLESIDHRIKVRAQGKTCVDFALHAMVTDVMDSIFSEVEQLPAHGVSSVKCFMAYKNSPLHVDDGAMYAMMRSSAKCGVTVFVHAENGDLIDFLQQECLRAGHSAPHYHAVSRPPFVEGEGARRAIYLAGQAGVPLYIAHVTSRSATEEIIRAQGARQRVMGETCTHYLTVTQDALNSPDFLQASKYICSPALRGREDVDYLWGAIQDGRLNAISSDHCGISLELKAQGLEDFTKIPNGAPGAADRIHMIWQAGVVGGKISRQLFVQTIATNPAKINGLYPKKGDILVGADADIVIFDPDYRGTIAWRDNPNGVDFNIYEGQPLVGRVETVLLRGNVVVENARFTGRHGQGQFVRSKSYGAAYTGL